MRPVGSTNMCSICPDLVSSAILAICADVGRPVAVPESVPLSLSVPAPTGLPVTSVGPASVGAIPFPTGAGFFFFACNTFKITCSFSSRKWIFAAHRAILFERSSSPSMLPKESRCKILLTRKLHHLSYKADSSKVDCWSMLRLP